MTFRELLDQIETGYETQDEETQAAEEFQDQVRLESEQARVKIIMAGRSSKRQTKVLEPAATSVARWALGLGGEIEDLRKMPYEKFLRTDYWRETRRLLLQKRGYRCEVCRKIYFEGSKRAVDVHHMSYAHRGYEFWHQKDLAVLCKKCHHEHHDGLIDANKIICINRGED